MYTNDSMPAASNPATSNTKKCASALKTVLGKRRKKSQPSIKKKQDFDSQNLFQNENQLNAITIKSGIAFKRVYNVEIAEVVNPKFMKKEKKDKPKVTDKKHRYQYDNAQSREKVKNSQKRSKLSNAQIKRKSKLSDSDRQKRNAEKLRKIQLDKNFNERKCSIEKPRSSLDHKKCLEHRLTTKIWQILSRDVLLLDHDKFNSQIQATKSETRKYIISVIKKCNNKEVNRLNRPQVTQTSKKSLSSSLRERKRALKCSVRRRVWQLAKASIKHSKHWSQFLADNNIILENINIDKFDLSLIDLDALGIENKLLKRTVTWLFK